MLAIIAVLLEILVRIFFPKNLMGPAYIYDPYTVYKLKPHLNTYRVFNGKKVALHTNAWGMRQNSEITLKKGKEIRLLFIGDSFTEGWGVDFEKSFVGLLTNYLEHAFYHTNIQILNGGVGGYGTEQMLRYFIYYGKKFNT